MPRSSKSANDDPAKCDAPIAEFVAFAKGLAAPRAARRLQALAGSPAAERFAERLVTEASVAGLMLQRVCASSATLVPTPPGPPSWHQTRWQVSSRAYEAACQSSCRFATPF